MRYLVPLNDTEGSEHESTSVAIVELAGKPKRRAKHFRKWLSREIRISDYHTQTAIIHGLGFHDLL